MSNHIKYFYIREKQSHQFRFNHISDLNDPQHPCHQRGRPIACVAYTRRPDEDLPGYDLVQYAVSVRSTKPDEETGLKDEFRKTDARELAATRLVKLGDRTTLMDDSHGFDVKHESTSTEVLADILDELTHHPWIPARVQRACQKWLDGES